VLPTPFVNASGLALDRRPSTRPSAASAPSSPPSSPRWPSPWTPAVQALFRAESGPVELPGRAIAPGDYRSILLNRQNDAPLDGLEELIVALHDIGEVLQRPSLARLVRIARAAKQVTEPPTAHYRRP
jgi:hypothetical protein